MKLASLIAVVKRSAIVAACALTLIGLSSQANAAALKTDIVMMVDESGSMGTVQANLIDNIGLFASILSAGGIDARFALVGYGASSPVPRVLTDFTDAVSFATAAGGLVVTGGTEPAFDASAFALNAALAGWGGAVANLTYRADAVKNLILYTDEPSNGDQDYNYATLDALIKSNNALYNTVLASYCDLYGDCQPLRDLALNNGGNVFNLDSLNTTDQTVVQTFVDSFARAKLQETIDFCVANPNDPACINADIPKVPAPAGVALIIGALALMTRQRGSQRVVAA